MLITPERSHTMPAIAPSTYGIEAMIELATRPVRLIGFVGLPVPAQHRNASTNRVSVEASTQRICERG